MKPVLSRYNKPDFFLFLLLYLLLMLRVVLLLEVLCLLKACKKGMVLSAHKRE